MSSTTKITKATKKGFVGAEAILKSSALEFNWTEPEGIFSDPDNSGSTFVFFVLFVV